MVLADHGLRTVQWPHPMSDAGPCRIPAANADAEFQYCHSIIHCLYNALSKSALGYAHRPEFMIPDQLELKGVIDSSDLEMLNNKE
jgi:hypothetical protein